MTIIGGELPDVVEDGIVRQPRRVAAVPRCDSLMQCINIANSESIRTRRSGHTGPGHECRDDTGRLRRARAGRQRRTDQVCVTAVQDGLGDAHGVGGLLRTERHRDEALSDVQRDVDVRERRRIIARLGVLTVPRPCGVRAGDHSVRVRGGHHLASQVVDRVRGAVRGQGHRGLDVGRHEVAAGVVGADGHGTGQAVGELQRCALFGVELGVLRTAVAERLRERTLVGGAGRREDDPGHVLVAVTLEDAGQRLTTCVGRAGGVLDCGHRTRHQLIGADIEAGHDIEVPGAGTAGAGLGLVVVVAARGRLDNQRLVEVETLGKCATLGLDGLGALVLGVGSLEGTEPGLLVGGEGFVTVDERLEFGELFGGHG